VKIIRLILLTLLATTAFEWAAAQVMIEDTSTNAPFFKASKFNSKGYVGFEAQATQILKNKAAMVLGLSLNWVINHKYVVSGKYQLLTSRVDVKEKVAPSSGGKIYLTHHFAGLAFSYILFHDKKFSFQPELAAGWSSAKFEHPTGTKYRHDFGAIIPAMYGVYNASKIFRVGIGLNYRAVFGTSFSGLKASDLNGITGVVFIRLGTF